LIDVLMAMFVPIAGFIVLSYGLFLWYRATELRYVLSNIEFREARFTSSLRPLTVVRNTIYGAVPAVLALVVLIGGLAISFLDYQLWLALAFITWFFVGRFISVVIVQYAILKHVAETLRFNSPEAFAEAAQTTGATPGYGEGFADTLDVGAF